MHATAPAARAPSEQPGPRNVPGPADLRDEQDEISYVGSRKNAVCMAVSHYVPMVCVELAHPADPGVAVEVRSEQPGLLATVWLRESEN